MSQDAKTQADRPAHRTSESELPERYVAHDEIARGGMGRVVEATDTLLERNVAVKQALTIDSEILRRFQRETKITARLEHPSIVPVYDAGRTSDGTPFYVMRKVSGRPLTDLIAAAETLDDRLALIPNVLAATQAIAHAHHLGVIHRDLKPSNILVGERGETIVIDWGLAKVIGEPDDDYDTAPIDAGNSLRTRVGTVVGTPGFMAPEQLEAKQVDARADVYALGATLYYTLTRKPPHASASETEMMSAALAGPPVPLDTLVADVPAELSAICDKALAFDDAVRYEDAGKLAEDLDRFLRGKLVAAHAYTAGERVARFVRKHRVPVAIGTIAVIALAAMAVVSIRGVIAARDEAIGQRTRAEAAASRETARANELAMAQARLLLDSDPRAALALIAPLARSPLWRQVRAIAAEAREAGIPHRLPGSSSTNAIAMSPDGLHLVAVGNDGVVRTYDLRTRESTDRGLASAPAHATWLDDTRLIVWDKTQSKLQLIGGDAHDIPLDKPVATLSARGGEAWWIDIDSGAWHLARDGAITHLAIADSLRSITLSPDGSRAAFAGSHGVWITGATIDHVGTEGCFGISWPSENRLMAVVRTGYLDVQLEPRKVSIQSREVTDYGIVVQGDHIYTAGLSGPRFDGEHPPNWPVVVVGGVLASGDDAVVMPRDNAIMVFIDTRHQDLFSPLGEIDEIVASRASHFIAAIDRGQLFVWNLDEVLPQFVDMPKEAAWQLSAFGDHQILFSFIDRAALWVDLAKRVASGGPALQMGLGFSASPAKDRLVLEPLDPAQSAHACAVGAPTCEAFAAEFHQTVFLDDHRIVGARSTGELVIHDLATHASEHLFDASADPVFRLSPNRNWLVVAYANGTVRRIELATRRASEHHAAARAWTLAELAIDDRGEVWLAEGRDLMRWYADTSTHPLATFTDPVAGFTVLDAHRAYVFTRASQGFIVDQGRPLVATVAAHRSQDVGYSAATGMLSVTREGGVTLVDLAVNATSHRARMMNPNDSLQMSSDGRFLFTYAAGRLWVFSIDMPQTPEATGAWVDAMAAP